MPQHIQAPDGSLVEFPDGVDDAAISAAMHQSYGGPDNRPASFLTGVTTGAMHGIDRAALGLNAGLTKMGVPMDAIDRAAGFPTTREIVQDRTARQAAAPTRPSDLGNFVGVMGASLPLALATKNPAVLGGLQGAMFGNSTTPEGLAAETVGGAALGHYGGKAMDALADFARPAIDPAVALLNKAGVKLTPGMVKGGKYMAREDKKMSKPHVGPAIAEARQATMDSFNIGAVNEALTPLGVKVPSPVLAGHDAINFAHDAVSKAYDAAIPNLAVNLDANALVAKLQPVIGTLGKTERAQLHQILTNQFKTGQLAGRELKNAQGEIRRLAGAYSRDMSADKKELGRALGEVDSFLWDEMIAQNPTHGPELQKVNTAFRGLATVEDAASRADGGVFNTAGLKQSVRRGDGSARKNATSRGDAFMQDYSEAARAVIPQRVPNSGTADRLFASSPMAHLSGGLDLAAFKAGQQLQALRLAPRGPGADKMAEILKLLKTPAAMGLIGSTYGARN